MSGVTLSCYCYCMIYALEKKRWCWYKLHYRSISRDVAVEFWNDQYELYRSCYTQEEKRQLMAAGCTRPVRVDLYVLRDRLRVCNPVVAQLFLWIQSPVTYHLVIRTLGVDWRIDPEVSARLLLDMQLVRSHMLYRLGLMLQTLVKDERMDQVRLLCVP
jgi:hypothetical protein